MNHGSTVNPQNFKIATGDWATVTHSRSSQLTWGDVVEDVLYVVESKFNPSSMSKLTRELNSYVVFLPDLFTLHDLFTGEMKDIGKMKDRLYMLGPQNLVQTQ